MRHHLPSPEVDARVREYVADFLWRPQRLIVETDGYDARRYTGRQVLDHPDEGIAARRPRLVPDLPSPSS